MPAYVIFTREGAIRDESAMETYARMGTGAYQAAIVHRKKGADYRAFIVEGL